MRILCGTILAAAMAAHGAECVRVPEDYARWVDPFVGTSATGHTFPAACVPFGLVQAGPDTGNGTWDYCSGYRYGDVTICGFTQTHLNGTGCPDLGDVRILPFTNSTRSTCSTRLNINPVKKLSEIAEPGYYAATLDDGIKVEIAAAEHSAIYRISARDQLRLLVDCAYGIGGKNYAKTITASNVKLDGKAGLSGRNHRRQWVERDYSFVVKFSRECRAVEEMPKSEGIVAPQYVFDFDVGESPLLVKVALSAEGGVEAAERNLAAEILAWDFDAVKVAAHEKWNEVLGRATIEGTDEQKKNWYTSLYHLFIQPNNIADAGGRPFYSTLSTWDTFRAAHPLYTILAPDKAAEFVDSMLEQGRRTGYLPIWTLWGHDNQCMIGTHSIPVIVDWFLKECKVESVKCKKQYWLAAYAQIKDTLTKPHKGRIKERWDLLDKYGYYPFDEIKGESVSRTMECAYDDWCAGMMAEGLGFKDDAEFFFKRAENWRNVFDPSIGLVRGKDTKGNWREPYNPYALGHGADLANDFTEGNAFQYTWHVMQNPQGLVGAMGGREAFVMKLDSLFLQPDTVEGSGCVVDVTGLIGQYVHGNEPSHHVIYFYPQVGHPEKAAERIREVFDKFYIPKPDGLCGNDDCGQMSAWYLFSAMGFYPFNPCGGEYVLGAPQVPEVVLNLGGSRFVATAPAPDGTKPVPPVTFTVIARNLSRENKYVKSVTLNGKPVTDWKIRHADIMSGGLLEFEMSNAAGIASLAARPPEAERTFRSEAVDAKIAEIAPKIGNDAVRSMFESCYPNTLDTTVKGDGYIITGDIDAMWLRDSAAQVWPYLRHLREDAKLKALVRSLVLRQFSAIRLDPYANAFYADEKKVGEWKRDMTDMKPGLHERKYEIDSLCYPVRLAYGYWKATGDASIFDGEWEKTLRTILATFREQQRKGGPKTSYRFQRRTMTPVDTLGNGGYGHPVKPIGLIASAFRPSDDATVLPFLIPSNFFAVDILRKAAEILNATGGDVALARECAALADEVSAALASYAVVETKRWGKVYAFEVDGFGGHILMDDANAPSLLSLPYLCGVDRHDPVYENTRRMILSPEGNPYFFCGKAMEGIGSPHTGLGKVWPMSLIMRILTSEDDAETRRAMEMLVNTTAGTGFMHESVNADNPDDFTRSWFAWANTLFGEVVLELVERGKAELLCGKSPSCAGLPSAAYYRSKKGPDYHSKLPQ